MKNIVSARILALSFGLLFPVFLNAQNPDSALQYRRSSLYSIMVSHPDQKMDAEIVGAFMELETPDKYNDHNLSVKCVTTSSRNSNARAEIALFLQRNNVAKRLVSKWFQRNKETGGFDADLVLERGLYDASVTDIEIASQSKRGVDALADKGYELIENTFVIVNDITYVDHEANADVATGIMSIIGGVASVVTGDEDNIITSLTTLGSLVSSSIAGFAVNINTHLYKLDWNDSVANYFYEHYYYEKPADDSASLAAFYADADIAARKAAFEADSTTFKLKYIGSYKSRSDKPVLRGLYNPEDVFRKVLARAVDKNIVNLQWKFDQFKVKVPVNTVNGNRLTAKIGLKEGVSAKSKYEVLVPVFDEVTGKISYTRKGIIRPEPGMIWDNRYMASEEQAAGSGLNSTTFRIISGTGILPGMLIREIK